MVETLGIATELAERRVRLAASQSPTVAARIHAGPYARIGEDLRRLTGENARLRKRVAELEKSLAVARETLTGIAQPRRGATADEQHADAMKIIRAMAREYGVTSHQILARLRVAHIKHARWAAMLAMRRVLGWTNRHIALRIGRDESSVRDGIKKAQHLHDTSEMWANRYHAAVNSIIDPIAEAA